MNVLKPSMPENGIVDACKQRMQAYISERDNAMVIEERLRAAEAKLHAVGAIHRDEKREEGRGPMCLGCGHISPCPTRLALAHFAPSK